MDIAGNLQWFVPLAVVLFGAFISFQRSVVSYKTTVSVFNPVEKLGSLGQLRLGAVRIRIKNTSHRHLKDVKISFHSVDVVAFGKFQGSTIGQIQLSNLAQDSNLEVTLPEMPALEVVTLDLLYANASLSDFAPVSGGGNRYRLCEQELHYLQNEIFWLQVSIASVAGFFITWMILRSLR